MHLGNNLIIQAEVPLISRYVPALKLNNTNRPANCQKAEDLIKYNCSNLVANNTGVYHISVSFELSGHSNPQLESNRVKIVAQCKLYNNKNYNTYICMAM